MCLYSTPSPSTENIFAHCSFLHQYFLCAANNTKENIPTAFKNAKLTAINTLVRTKSQSKNMYKSSTAEQQIY